VQPGTWNTEMRFNKWFNSSKTNEHAHRKAYATVRNDEYIMSFTNAIWHVERKHFGGSNIGPLVARR
jgi:heme-degrading monooxygenase HmoA